MSRIACAAIGLVTALLLSAASAQTASADFVALDRRTVCADSLYVREAPAGVWTGTLWYPQTFDVERYSPSREWVYGFAYGHVNRHGWVQNGWFC